MNSSFPRGVRRASTEYPLVNAERLTEAHQGVLDKLEVMDRLARYELFRLVQQETSSLQDRRLVQLAEEPGWGRGISRIISLVGSGPLAPDSVASQTPQMRRPVRVSEGSSYESGATWLYQQALELAAILQATVHGPASGETLLFPDGSEFVGPVTNGWPSGVGKMTLADSTVVVGEMGPPPPGSPRLSGEDAEILGWICETSPDGSIKARSVATCRLADRNASTLDDIALAWSEGNLQLSQGSNTWVFAADGWQWETETEPRHKQSVSVIIQQDASRRVVHTDLRQQPLRVQGTTLGSSGFGGAASLALAMLNAPASQGLDLGDLQNRPLSILRRDYQRHPPLESRQTELVRSAPESVRELVAKVDLSRLADLQDEVIADTYFVADLDDPSTRSTMLAQSQKRPVMVSGGWKGHNITYVLFKNTLYVCNRGSGALQMPFVAGASKDKGPRLLSSEFHFTFAPERFDELCDRLLLLSTLRDDRARDILYGNAPQSLLTSFAPNQQYSWGNVVKSAQYAQRRGNCALFSPLTATYVSTRLLLDTLLDQQFPQIPKPFRDEAAQYLSRQDYRALRGMQRAAANLTLRDLRIDLPEQHKILYTPHTHDATGRAILPPVGRGLIADQAGLMLYEGQLKEGKPHGFGQGATTRGFFEGMWRDGEPDGPGTLTLDDGRVYHGRMVRGEMSGPGSMTYLDGRTLMGLFRNGVLQDGRACIKTPEWVYEGHVEGAEPSGKGRLTWADPAHEGRERKRLVGTFQKTKGQEPICCSGLFVDALDRPESPTSERHVLPTSFSFKEP